VSFLALSGAVLSLLKTIIGTGAELFGFRSRREHLGLFFLSRPRNCKARTMQLFRLERTATTVMAAKNKDLADLNRTRIAEEATNRRLHPSVSPVVQMRTRGRVSSLPRWRGPTLLNQLGPTMNLKTMAREAARRGDTETLVQTLDLLEAADANCLRPARCLHGLLHRTRGTPPARAALPARAETSGTHQHCLRAMSAPLAKQFASLARCCLELARSAEATHRARFVQMAHEYWLASLRIREQRSSDDPREDTPYCRATERPRR
jgi:hypothetical protein